MSRNLFAARPLALHFGRSSVGERCGSSLMLMTKLGNNKRFKKPMTFSLFVRSRAP
eukprot:jgi/Pico_ML_1/53676/g4184.t1